MAGVGKPPGRGTRKGAALAAALLLLLRPVAITRADPLDDAVAAQARRDYAAALRLLRPLAEAGDAAAQKHLADQYEHGWGVVKDEAEGLKWYRKAAEQGHAEAQGNLGEMYSNGDGVAQDLVQAPLWLSLAMARLPQGMRRTLAAEDRERVSGKMTPEQLAEAHRLAREWKPK